MNLCQGVRINLHYAVMSLSTYMSHPNICAYDALHHCMTYLIHHPHLPIMYPRKQLRRSPLRCHFECGDAEIKSLKSHTSLTSTTKPTSTLSNNPITLRSYHDSNLGRDLLTRRSVNASVHELNGVAIVWTCKKKR